MVDPPERHYRRYLPLVIGAAILVSGGLWLEYGRRRPKEAPAPSFVLRPPTRDSLPGRDRPQAATPEGDSEAADASRLYSPPRPAESDPEEAIDRFIKLFAGEDASPDGQEARKALVEEFRREPALKKAFDDYRNAPKSKMARQELMQKLSSLPQFRQLTARYGGASGSASTLAVFQGAKGRDANAIAREWAGKARVGSELGFGPAQRGGGPAPSAPVGPSGPAGPATKVNLGGAASGAADSHEAVAAVRRLRADAGGAAGGASGGLNHAAGPAGEGAAAARKSAGGGGGGPTSAAAGRGTDPMNPQLDKGFLDPSKADSRFECGNDPVCDYKKQINAMLQAMPEANRRQIEAALGVRGETPTAVDLLSACFVTNNFKLCKAMCLNPGVTCSQTFLATTYWQACRSGDNQDPYACVGECVKRWQDGCAADPAVRAAGCRDMLVDCQYCAGRQYGTKVITLAGLPPRQATVPRWADEVCSPIKDAGSQPAPTPGLPTCGRGLDCSLSQNAGATLCNSPTGGAGQDVYCCPTGQRITSGSCAAGVATVPACGSGLICSLSDTPGASLCHSATGGDGQDVYCCPLGEQISGGRCSTSGGTLPPCGTGLDCSLSPTAGASFCHSASGGDGQDVYCCPLGKSVNSGSCKSNAGTLPPCGTGLDCSLSATSGATFCHSASGGDGQDVYCCPTGKSISAGACVSSTGGRPPPCGTGLDCSLSATAGASFCHSASGGDGQDVFCCPTGEQIISGGCVPSNPQTPPPCGAGLDCSLGQTAGASLCHSASGGAGQDVYCCPLGSRISGDACVPPCGTGLDCSLSATAGATFCHSASGGGGQDVFCCPAGKRIRNGACATALPPCGLGLDCSLSPKTGANFCHSASGGGGQDVYCCPSGESISGSACVVP